MPNHLVLSSDLPAVLAIPKGVDWRRGDNRGAGKCQIAAKDDLSAIHAWLATYQDSPKTFETYRKEALRLLLWAAHTVGKPISSLTHEDLMLYRKFIQDPQPASLWVNRHKRPIGHPDWRPFSGPLAASSQRQAMVILNTMFNWLVGAGYLAGNPLALSRKRDRRKRSGRRASRHLGRDLLESVFSHIEGMPQATTRDRKHRARCRWIFALLYLTGLRISEAVEHKMGDFYLEPDDTGAMCWWIDVRGKGGREDSIPVTDELIDELKRYRRAFDMPSDLPRHGESTPLIFSIGPKRAKLTRQSLHRIIKIVLRNAAAGLRETGNEENAERLEKASAHWLRHSMGTHLMEEGAPLVDVRDLMRHENIATTNIYVHTDDKRKRKVMQEKHRLQRAKPGDAQVPD